MNITKGKFKKLLRKGNKKSLEFLRGFFYYLCLVFQLQ